MASSDSELEQLRKRAYGRQADIHLDPDALQRLRELEGEQSAKQAAGRPEADEPTETVQPHEPVVDEPNADGMDISGAETPNAPERRPRPTAKAVLMTSVHRLAKLRRSTVVIALAAVAFAVAVVVVLTLVQRVQTDPLQAGASQVARLQADSGYRVPDAFGGAGTGGANAQAFEAFRGLRVILFSEVHPGAPSGKDVCIDVYPEAEIDDPSSTSFSGVAFGGCSAGGFPAIAQFNTQGQDLPTATLNAVAPWTSLQFVYDERDDEVVVFGLK